MVILLCSLVLRQLQSQCSCYAFPFICSSPHVTYEKAKLQLLSESAEAEEPLAGESKLLTTLLFLAWLHAMHYSVLWRMW